jgi:hypothetical protein
MIFLQSHGVSSAYATKIFKTYGNESIEVVQEDPYRLATEFLASASSPLTELPKSWGLPKTQNSEWKQASCNGGKTYEPRYIFSSG